MKDLAAASSLAAAALVIHPNRQRSLRSLPQKRSRLRSSRAFELLPGAGPEPILDPDSGSWIWPPRAETPRSRVRKKTRSRAACSRNWTTLGVPAHIPGTLFGEGEPAELPDSMGHPGPGRVGEAFSLGARFSPGSFEKTWHTFHVDVAASPVGRGPQLASRGVG